MDKTLKRIIKETAEELNLPVKQVELILTQQHEDIFNIARNKKSNIEIIFLKYFGTFSVHGKIRRPFRSDSYKSKKHNEQEI